ncbi:MAG TPA: alpha/beta hydrolase [Pseudomonadales bacterium]
MADIDPTEHEYQTSGPRLTYFEWGSPGQQPVLLVHATGFHARCWDQVVRALGPGYHVYAVDMRGHGRSERVAPYVWDTFARDVSELVEHLQLSAAIGVGHSMGGHCLVQVAASHPGAFSRLVLVDPVIFEPDAYEHDRYRGFGGPEDHPVSKRKNDWVDWREMYERFKDRGSFAVWNDDVLVDYCRYGVLPRAEGGYELACPPLVEASIYLGNTSTNVYEVIPDVQIPVVVLRAPGRGPDDQDKMDFSKSPTWPHVAEQFAHGTDVFLPNFTHFIPMQDPELVARYIAGAEQGNGPG